MARKAHTDAFVFGLARRRRRPSEFTCLARSFPSSRPRSQIKDHAGVLTHVRYDAVADGPLRFVRSLAASPPFSSLSSFCFFAPSFARSSHSIFPCSYLLVPSGYRARYSRIRQSESEGGRGSPYRKSGCCSASRALVSRITARACS